LLLLLLPLLVLCSFVASLLLILLLFGDTLALDAHKMLAWARTAMARGPVAMATAPALLAGQATSAIR
jgi:hypothetical protein